MQVEGNIMDVVAQVIQVLHDQNFFADGSLLRRETVCQFTADHQRMTSSTFVSAARIVLMSAPSRMTVISSAMRKISSILWEM